MCSTQEWCQQHAANPSASIKSAYAGESSRQGRKRKRERERCMHVLSSVCHQAAVAVPVKEYLSCVSLFVFVCEKTAGAPA